MRKKLCVSGWMAVPFIKDHYKLYIYRRHESGDVRWAVGYRGLCIFLSKKV